MRAICGFVAAALIGGSQPALAQCFGEYPATVCVSSSGDVWTSGGGYYRYTNRPPRIAKFPNASGARPNSAPPASAGGMGETVVLQPSAQSGNAWLATPSSSGGATVLNGASSAP